MEKVLQFAMRKNYFRFGCQFFYWCLHDGSMFTHILFTLVWHHRALDTSF